MPRVLHLLPHAGGGGELYVDLLAAMPGYESGRMMLSPTRAPARAVPAIVWRWPAISRAVGASDLVHVHGDVSATLTAPLLRRRPSVLTTHGLPRLRRLTGPAHTAFARVLGRAIANARATICTSETERAELLALLPAALHGRLTVVRNGVAAAPPPDPARRAATRMALAVGEDELLLLFLGGLEADKDPMSAVAAARAAREQGHPVVLALAGEGPLAAPVRAAQGAAVRPLGFRSDVPRLLEAADVFVLPSKREGMSFALLEAMSWGLPSVVCEGSGTPETVADGGLVVPYGDPQALAAALRRLVEDPSLRARLGAAARARIADELSLERFLKGTRLAYERALGRTAAASGEASGATVELR